ncbi:site-specific integrase [Streptomyces sp. MNU76]|uniref:site-specific integrase n=1 Tax=Streptomyces sp. MNU76 TaxID=2560026 RepID=UPI001E44A9C5|nr:site-specific integrase [Streptomyces sp. MNU76]MCC9708949.1 site-specific integrase [Streptomyces sp. MNU76]
MTTVLPLLSGAAPDRTVRDRLEILTALIAAPSFDPLFRDEIIQIPGQHSVFTWGCQVPHCERPGYEASRLCATHDRQWRGAHARGERKAVFLASAEALVAHQGFGYGRCRVCPGRPAHTRELRLCERHEHLWSVFCRDETATPDLEQWAADQSAFHSFGTCRVPACAELSVSPLGLCLGHRHRYNLEGRPGGATIPQAWRRVYEDRGRPVPVNIEDEHTYAQWRARTGPLFRAGQINLKRLRPLVRAEIQWGLFAHTQEADPGYWAITSIQRLVAVCRERGFDSLADADTDGEHHKVRAIARSLRDTLQVLYSTPEETKEAGYIETEHFGRRFPRSASRIDLTAVSQPWLRDLLWDHLAALMRSHKCPRSRAPLDNARRACMELSAFLAIDAPDVGHDPRALTTRHAERFVADQRQREGKGMPTLARPVRDNGTPSLVTPNIRRIVFNYSRKILYDALESGEADRIGLDRSFITAFPPGGEAQRVSRNPFTDQVARALADEANLQQFAREYDVNDRGLRDIWEALVLTGRRCSEVLKLRLDCVGRYHGRLPMLWHDQTKVGNYNEGIRIPERLYTSLEKRRRTTLERFELRNGRQPTAEERTGMALFPTEVRNRGERRSISHTFFHLQFKSWVDSLDLGKCVPHQARHTLATKLLSNGASLAHIRRYLGQVSDRMAEHYAKVADSEIETVLQAVWVSGPGAARPGELLTGAEPLSREQATALALDLSRRSTPAEGGFCTFQPVVNGDACPWKLNCEGCDKFVLSGADLLYWRRKQEQWRSIAERAPDDATADYLHQVFEPTARAIDGLERVLAGLGLLEDALALDLRRPQDFYHRLWNTAFQTSDLADLASDAAYTSITEGP